MKKILLLMIFGLISYSVRADPGKFILNCKVQSNDIVKIDEGKVEKFSGYSNGFSIGDTLTLTYLAAPNGLLHFALRDNEREEDHIRTLFTAIDFIEYDETDSKASYVKGNKTYRSAMHIRPDYTFISSHNYTLKMQRYYKDDWQGMAISNIVSSQVHIFTLDCRTNTGSTDSLLKTIKGFSKKPRFDPSTLVPKPKD